jgi:hypothetical protein
MHVYRPDASYLADFREVTDKPKWLSECGAINYSDPTGSSHAGMPGNDELYKPTNDPSTRSLMLKAINSGFSLCMPWSLADNPGIVDYIGGGLVTGSLGLWIKNALSK